MQTAIEGDEWLAKQIKELKNQRLEEYKWSRVIKRIIFKVNIIPVNLFMSRCIYDIVAVYFGV